MSTLIEEVRAEIRDLADDIEERGKVLDRLVVRLKEAAKGARVVYDGFTFEMWVADYVETMQEELDETVRKLREDAETDWRQSIGEAIEWDERVMEHRAMVGNLVDEIRQCQEKGLPVSELQARLCRETDLSGPRHKYLSLSRAEKSHADTYDLTVEELRELRGGSSCLPPS